MQQHPEIVAAFVAMLASVGQHGHPNPECEVMSSSQDRAAELLTTGCLLLLLPAAEVMRPHTGALVCWASAKSWQDLQRVGGV
jgi:hypothetical protein